jgi:peptidoglycan/LPS O-acetylase OafA/YrhL
VIVFHASFYMQKKEITDPIAQVVVFGVNHLWLGVPMFFVISGYCLAAAADSASRKGMKASEFFLRRFRRIYPPYWIFTFIAVFVVGYFEAGYAKAWLGNEPLFNDSHHQIDPPWGLNLRQWIGNLTLTEMWRYQFVDPTHPDVEKKYFLANIWTLCYEEQFYLVMGLLVCFFPKRIFSGSIIVTILALGARHIFPKAGELTGGWLHKLPTYGFFFDGNWNLFAAGIWVYYCVNYLRPERGWLAYGVLMMGVAYSLRDRSVLSGEYNTDLGCAIALTFAMLLVAMHPWDRQWHEHAWTQPITWCGVMCYSLYLVHWPITKAISHICFWQGIDTPLETMFVSVPICVTSSVICGYYFHVFVEKAFLNTPTNLSPATDSLAKISSHEGNRILHR